MSYAQKGSDHFVDVNKMVALGSGSERKVDDRFVDVNKTIKLGSTSARQ